MAGGIDWFRWHHGSVTDPKFALVAKKSGARLGDVLAVWAYILEHASSSEDRGAFGDLDCEAVDCLLSMDDGQTERILGAMQNRCLIGDGKVSAWPKRQPKREREDDTAAERKRRQRERASQGQESDANENNVTPCHAMSHQKTPRGEERREEVNNLSVVGDGGQPAAPENPAPTEKPMAKKSKATRLPAEFYPDDTGVAYAESRKIPLAVELESFRNWHTAKGNAFANWQAAWRTWCDKAVEFGRGGAPPNGKHRKTTTEIQIETIAGLTGRAGNDRPEHRAERDITGEATRLL